MIIRSIASVAFLLGVGLSATIAHAAKAGEAPVVTPIEVAAGVTVFPGQPAGPASAANQGRQANIALVTGPTGALVWNSGVSHRHGQELLLAMLARIEVPIRSLVISHAYQDVLFGWSAFSEVGVPVLMHEAAVKLMHKRCQGCLERLTETLGPAQMIGTRLAEPSQIISGPMPVNNIGRSLQILDAGHSSGPNDLMLFDHQSGTLFTGATVMTDTITEIHDGQIDTWIEALTKLDELAIRQLVPDYGAIGDAGAIQTTLTYLRGLKQIVGDLLERGVTLAESGDHAAMPQFESWPGYQEHHGRNVHHLYLILESRSFE